MAKARAEGATSKKKARKARPSTTFRAMLAQFREQNPDKWDEIALTPTQHGVEAIAEVLEKH